MTVAVCLISVAAVVAWPRRPERARMGGRPIDLAALGRAVVAEFGRRPRRALAGAVCGACGLGLLFGGPVAAAVGAAYAALAWRAATRRAAARRELVRRAAELDGLAALAADLRAGLPAGAPGAVFGDRIGRLATSVGVLAEQTGAPAADLVERIEADARATDRAAAAAAAQAAGAQLTAMLLAALPLAGIGLGIAAGADPTRVLFHTPVGGACAVAAVLLQSAGLVWADRIAETVTR